MTLTRGRRIVLARYHDGTAKANWGGRGTSLALAGLIAGIPEVDAVIPLNGSYITEGFGDFTPADKVVARLRHVRRHGVRYRSAPLETRPFERIDEYAARLLSGSRVPRFRRLIETIESGDELWMNGEGNFIMGYSGELWRTLIIMAIAQRLGKRTVLLNSILSEPSSGDPAPTVLSGVRMVLERCAAVAYRDPTSLDRSREWFPSVQAEWLPDALFQWARIDATVEPYSAAAEGLPLDVQALLGRERIVVLSGSSTLRFRSATRVAAFGALVGALRAQQVTPVFAATSDEDEWWAAPAEELGVPFVPARIPLASGRTLLAAAELLISGRYHPSILAVGVGTSIVTFGSNSHKTTSLHRVLGDANAVEFPGLDRDPRKSGLTDGVGLALADASERGRALAAVAREAAGRVMEGVRTVAVG